MWAMNLNCDRQFCCRIAVRKPIPSHFLCMSVPFVSTFRGARTKTFVENNLPVRVLYNSIYMFVII